MKSTSKSSRVHERYGMIEPLEARIAPAAATVILPANPQFVTVTAGGSLLVKAGQVLTSGSGGSGAYFLYVAQGEVLVHTTDLNHNNAVDFNEITGLSVANGTVLVSFVDIHGDIVTDLNPDGTLDDGGKGDILLDANITEIDMRSLTTADFSAASSQTATALVNDHLAISNYSIFGNIYAGGGLGLANDASSGLVIDTSGVATQSNDPNFVGTTGGSFYQTAIPYVGSVFAGTAASGQSFSFGASGSTSDIFGNLLAFNPKTGEAGASIYNISAAATGEAFNIGTLHAGDGGFNAAGGSVVNVALNGNNYGVIQLIAGNAGIGTIGQPGGNIANFSEASATVSAVILQSGNGGTGLTGAGGNAGQITLDPSIPTQVSAHLTLNYGNGGDGYTVGGNGGGTPTGTFTVPSGGAITRPSNVVTTYHAIGTIGSNTPFDFDGDGYSDAVFSTTSPDQVVVAFGDNSIAGGISNFQLDSVGSHGYIYLNAPAQVDSIVVGNFTGLLNPVTHQPELDIAVASGTGSYAGVYVYLSEYSAKTGAFEGFSSPLFTPLPSLAAESNYFTSTPITKLVAGDFTGNGVLGLAVLAQETELETHIVDSYLIYLNGETSAAHPGGSGYFYANFTNGNQPFINFGGISPTNSIFEATALKTFTPTVPTAPGQTPNPSNGHDVIIEADSGSRSFAILDDSTATLAITKGVPSSNGFGFGQVDTNRLVGGTFISLANFTVQGIAITQDQTNPTVADLAVLSQSPADFLETFLGSGTNGPNAFTLETGSGTDQAGIDFGYQNPRVADPIAIVAVPNTAKTFNSDVAILDFGASSIYTLNISADLTTAGLGPAGTQQWGLGFPPDRNNATIAFSVYYPHPVTDASIPGSGPDSFGFITGNPVGAFPDVEGFFVSSPYYTTTVSGLKTMVGGTYQQPLAPFKVAGFFFNAGNGGSSQAGAGGAGGSFGHSLSVSGSGSTISGLGTLSVVFPSDPNFSGTAEFTGGAGGNGFTHGGAGGNLAGISVTYATGTTVLGGVAELFAGSGGTSLTGAGGAGGSESQLFVYTGELFVAGSGGIGVVGGSGGAVLGNPQTGLFTSETNNFRTYVEAVGGTGAPGITAGGNGGTIDFFTNDFLPLISGTGGELIYLGGAAGGAVAGRGGTGGSILNSSPSNIDNNLAGDIYLQAGDGGSGLSGGGGGNINTFVQISTINEPPSSFTVLAGFGGNATLGNGGAGGAVSGVTLSASGISTEILIPDPNTPSLTTPLLYNRMVAGAGGTSAGGTGGTGGSISSITTASVAANTQNVAAAGAGGDGLIAGGSGGSVISASMDAGATAGSASGKVVVIAGDGGTSDSVRARANDPQSIAFSIGGTDGPGGNGGNITNFTQPTSTTTHVDLIAGNGGATLNHSVIAGNASKDNSGKGGSIINVAVTGSIGNSDPNAPIISYNNIFTGITANGVQTGVIQNGVLVSSTMQDFVDNYILGGLSNYQAGVMSDAIGNVGLVAGAAGRVEGSDINAPSVASTDGVSGTVSNVHAENIMSMIAGNVDQVDFIQSLSNFGVTANGVLGAPKTAFYDPVAMMTVMVVEGNTLVSTGLPQYLDATGAFVHNPLPGGGELIDGAIIAKNIPILESARQF